MVGLDDLHVGWGVDLLIIFKRSFYFNAYMVENVNKCVCVWGLRSYSIFHWTAPQIWMAFLIVSTVKGFLLPYLYPYRKYHTDKWVFPIVTPSYYTAYCDAWELLYPCQSWSSRATCYTVDMSAVELCIRILDDIYVNIYIYMLCYMKYDKIYDQVTN